MEKKRCIAVVLAAGSGSRMKSDVAKQYMLLQGRPLIWYALHAIEESSVIDDCILVTGAEDISYVREEIVEHYGFHKVSAVIAGGQERYDSVYHALKLIEAKKMTGAEAGGYVFIHDGARPFLTEEILQRCLAEVERTGACVTGMPVKDTIKIADAAGYAAQTPERRLVWQIQTPQVFEIPLITAAYEAFMQDKAQAADGCGITDDAMAVENYTGKRVSLVRGSYENIKITTPEDLVIAEALLSRVKMFCILVTGMPAAGKSTMAKAISERLKLPVISRDAIKELLFDHVGFQSRAEKVNLGIAGTEIMYYVAGQLMKAGQPFILENNFEYSSEHGIKKLLEQYRCPALTITLTGDYKVIYQRFVKRESSPDRHRGHVVNDCYPEKEENHLKTSKAGTISYENYVHGIEERGFDTFCADGRQIKVDTTDFSKINMEELFARIAAWKEEI